MYIQEEIIIDMLIRLPVKSLCRFKCVSKSWKALICEPSFKKKHFSHAKNDKLLLKRTANGNIFFYCSSLSRTTATIVRDVQESVCVPQCRVVCSYIYGSCNGLFVIDINRNFFLWNPCTRESILIPSLWDETCDLEFNYGLGYDPISDEYKVVLIPEADESAPTEIFSLKTGSRRKIYGGYCALESMSKEYLILFQESFHWLTFIRERTFSLISLNISNEMFKELPLSKEMPLVTDATEQGVEVLGGMVSVHFTFIKEDTIIYDLWVMKEYGMEESWTKLCRMRDRREWWDVLPIIPKYIFEDGEVLLTSNRRYLLRTSKDEATDTRSNVIVPLTTDEATDTTKWDGYVYTETLISPKDCVLALYQKFF